MAHVSGDATVEQCEPIPDKNSPTGFARIAVTQYEAQKESHNNHNKIIKMATRFLNEHISDISSVNIEYDGKALSGKIGNYLVTAFVQRSVDDTEVSECHTIDYLVEDVNECELNTHHCGESTLCVNTIGSYECACPDGYNGVEGSGGSGSWEYSGLCGGNKDTSECCPLLCARGKYFLVHKPTKSLDIHLMEWGDCLSVAENAGTLCLEKCKANFQCSSDPCTNNRCHSKANCVADSATHTYECVCWEGYVGDGFSCHELVLPNFCEKNTCLSPCECTNDYTQNGYR